MPGKWSVSKRYKKREITVKPDDVGLYRGKKAAWSLTAKRKARFATDRLDGYLRLSDKEPHPQSRQQGSRLCESLG